MLFLAKDVWGTGKDFQKLAANSITVSCAFSARGNSLMSGMKSIQYLIS
jgi:hypothetical protein